VRLEFVDTNVLLYAHDVSAGDKQTIARGLLARLAADRAGAVSIQVLQEFYVNATRKLGAPLSRKDALKQVNMFATWAVHSPTASDVMEAAKIAEDNTVSFWDAMVVRSAAEMRCATLWTEDLNNGQQIEGVTVANPFAP
jgi:predicted nucleic acid-binding protein